VPLNFYEAKVGDIKAAFINVNHR